MQTTMKPAPFIYPATPRDIPADVPAVHFRPYPSATLHTYYGVPDGAPWRYHFDAWCRARGEARAAGWDLDALPMPMPIGHVMFETAHPSYWPIERATSEATLV
jgi:hypothetical protein